MNEDEPLMTSGAPTIHEKLIWERYENKQLKKEVFILKEGLKRMSEQYGEYKNSVEKSNIAQMLNKLNRIKKINEALDAKCVKLTLQNEELICSLGKANLKIKEYKQKEESWLSKLLKKKN